MTSFHVLAILEGFGLTISSTEIVSQRASVGLLDQQIDLCVIIVVMRSRSIRLQPKSEPIFVRVALDFIIKLHLRNSFVTK